MKQISSKVRTIVWALAFLTAGACYAGDSMGEGYAIAGKSDSLFRSFGDETVNATMYLINAKGDTVVRRTISQTLERENSEDYSLIQFLDPPDVKGTGLLTYQNPRGDDRQWLYLPELRRVKKISSKNKSGSFMGSEFAYEDITGNTLDKFKYEKLADDTLDGKPCYILKKIPTYENSGYTSIKQWFSKETYLPMRAEFTDRKNSLLKVQSFNGFEKIGDTWRIEGITMKNLQTGKKSVIEFTDRKLHQGLEESDFTQRSLQRLIR